MKKTLAILSVTIIAAALTWAASSPQSVDVTVKKVEPFAYVCMSQSGPPTAMGQVINDLMTFMTQQNIAPAGNLITVYHTSPYSKDPMDAGWDIGFPVASQVTMTREPLVKKEWNHDFIATAIHVGYYEETGDTINAIFDWMENNGYEQDGPIVGVFLELPNPDTPADSLRTEIWVPIKDK